MRKNLKEELGIKDKDVTKEEVKILLDKAKDLLEYLVTIVGIEESSKEFKTLAFSFNTIKEAVDAELTDPEDLVMDFLDKIIEVFS